MESSELIYRQLVDALKRTSDETIPTCKKNFFKFWWDQDLDELKSRSVVSCDIWKAAGRPRSGPIFREINRPIGMVSVASGYPIRMSILMNYTRP